MILRAMALLCLGLILMGCAGSTRPPDIRVPLPTAPARLETRCPLPTVSEGQDAVQALYGTRAALKTCEGKRRDWQRFYKLVRAKR